MLLHGPGIVSHLRIHRNRVQSSAGILPAVARASCPRTLAVSPLLLIFTACLALSACPSSTAPTQITSKGPSVQVVETTGDQTMLLQAQPSVSFGTGGSSSSLVVTVDATTQDQQIDGFGGSLTDSSAWLIWNKLSASQQTTLMQQLFSPSTGIGISFLRQPMGATDFTNPVIT